MKKPVFKTIKKIFLILIPVYAVWFLYIEYMPLYFNQSNNTRWYFIKEILKGKTEIPESNVIFLGESRVNAAIDFNCLPNAFSFASGGSSPIEMYYILKKYTEQYGKPDTVFFSVSPRFLSEIYAFYPYAVRNDLFNNEDFKEVYSLISENDTTLGNMPFGKYILYKMNYIEYYQSDVMQNYVIGALDDNKKLIKDMLYLKGGRIHPGLKDSCSDLNYETDYKHFNASPILTIYFDKIFEFCNKEKIHLIFDFIPVNKSSHKAFCDDFIDEYRSFINDFSLKYPMHDISDTVYYYENVFFGDESHMNSKGKEKYTKYLYKNYFNKKSL